MKSNSTLKLQSISCFAPKKLNLILSPAGINFFSLLLLCLLAVSANAQSLPNYPSLTFNSPVLKSGTDLQAGAVYTFPNVTTGVDAEVTIMGMTGGAWLSEIDNTSGAGYYDAFQPYVGAGANDTSYIDWKFVFKKTGTNTDTILPVLAVTGVDVDGDNGSLKEFIQAATPGSFALDPNTYLNFSFDGVRSTATSTIDNYALIDTANRRSMFQMNFTNINTILYRNGAITTGGSQVRQTSIYFKSFFNWQTVLPVKLLSFEAKANSEGTNISWSATDEDDLKYYVVEKSADGNKWKEISHITPAVSRQTNTYTITDNEENKSTVYYRLRQINANGSSAYSKTVKLMTSSLQTIHSYASNKRINVQINTKNGDEDYVFDIYTIAGVKVMSSEYKAGTGINQFNFELPSTSGRGIFLLSVRNKSGKPIYTNKIPVI